MTHTYYPDAYRFVLHDGDIRLFSSWKGSFANGDAWRLNSRVIGIKDMEEWWEVVSESGSIYHLKKERGSLTAYTQSVHNQLMSHEGVSEISIEESIKILEDVQMDQRHHDDKAVETFAQLMKDKLKKSRDKGRGGWDDSQQCRVEYLAELLLEHIKKENYGNFVDIANLAMMLHLRGANPNILNERNKKR